MGWELHFQREQLGFLKKIKQMDLYSSLEKIALTILPGTKI